MSHFALGCVRFGDASEFLACDEPIPADVLWSVPAPVYGKQANGTCGTGWPGTMSLTEVARAKLVSSRLTDQSRSQGSRRIRGLEAGKNYLAHR